MTKTKTRDVPGLNPLDIEAILKTTVMTCNRFRGSDHGNAHPKTTGEAVRCLNCNDPQWKHWLRQSLPTHDAHLPDPDDCLPLPKADAERRAARLEELVAAIETALPVMVDRAKRGILDGSLAQPYLNARAALSPEAEEPIR